MPTPSHKHRGFGRLRSSLSVLFGRSRFEREMSDELRFHIEAYAADLRQQGLTLDEANRRARAAFGGVGSVTEEIREARGLRWWDELRQDVGYAFRIMRRSPSFSAAVVVSVGVGIGANTATFSLVDAVLLRPLPVTNPGELYFLAHGEGDRPIATSNYSLLERFRTAPVFAGVTAFETAGFIVTGGEIDEHVLGQYVSGNYHAVVGPRIVLGRGFTNEPDRPAGGETIAVISEAYWTRRFGRAPDVVGRTLTIRDRPVTIVGVEAFAGFIPGSSIDITMPLSARIRSSRSYLTAPEFGNLVSVARIRRDVSVSQATAAADTLFQQFMLEPSAQSVRAAEPQQFTRARLTPAGRGTDLLRDDFRRPLLVLMGMAALVLLAAAANVANLLLARSSARAKEMAIRLCVGSGRWRLVRQVLTECLILASVGGVLGVVLAVRTADLIVALFSGWAGGVDLTIDTAPNLRVAAFAATLVGLTGLAFGLLPALRMTAVDLSPNLKGGDPVMRSPGRVAIGRGLIVVQVAVSVVVLVTSALLAQSVRNLKGRPGGFDPSRVAVFDMSEYGAPMSHAERRSTYAAMVQRLEKVPGVVAVSLATTTPVSWSGTPREVAVETLPASETARRVSWAQISPEYFRALGMQVLQGRSFDDADVTGERPVAILSERAVRQMFQVPNPIGRTFEWADAPNRPVEVVGIVEDHLPYGLRDEPMRTVYTPMSNSALRDGVVVVAKASLPATALAATAREFVRASGRKLLVGGIRTMESQINDSIGHERALAWLSAAFAMLAAILAGVGLYGVMSYQVARQTHEIGVRLAIGARPATVLADMLGRGLALTGIGIAAGLVVAWFATSAVSTLLYGLSPTDPATVAGVVVGLGSVALAATYLPARRAARIDPLQALRSE